MNHAAKKTTVEDCSAQFPRGGYTLPLHCPHRLVSVTFGAPNRIDNNVTRSNERGSIVNQSGRQRAQAWIRQLYGNTGTVGYEEAMEGLRRIEENSQSGLFPTTSGAVSLMRRDDVEALFRANRGLFPKFRPVVPDAAGRPAKSLGD